MSIDSPQLFSETSDMIEPNETLVDQTPTSVDEMPAGTEGVAMEKDSKPGKKISKASRIRTYMLENPNAKNLEIAEKLSEFGVAYQDVSGVRGILKRKEAEEAKKAGETVTAEPDAKAAESLERRGRPKKPAKAQPKPAKPTPKSVSRNSLSEINLADLETGLSFIEKVNGVENARRIIDLVARIRQASIG